MGRSNEDAPTRGTLRYRPPVEIAVVNDATEEFLGEIVDISSRGIQILAPAPLEREQPITLRFRLPIFDNDSGSTVRLPARVAWCRTDEDGQRSRVGFVFEPVEASARHWLDRFLKKSCEDEPEPPL